MKKEKKIRVLIFEPNKAAREAIIANELKVLQKLVGGYIELVRVTGDVLLICNEEFLLFDFEPNRSINGQVIHGTFVLVTDDNEEFGSLSDKNIELFINK